MTDDRPCIVTPCGGAAPRGAPVRASPLATRCPRPRVAEQAAPPRHHHVHRSLTYFPDGRRANAGPGDDPPEPPPRPPPPPPVPRRASAAGLLPAAGGSSCPRGAATLCLHWVPASIIPRTRTRTRTPPSP